MHFMSQLRYNPISRRDEFYYRIKESFRDLTGRVCSRIMLNVGFINEDHQPEDIRDIGKCLTYLHEHQTHDRPVNQFWKDKLTEVLIDSVKADDGILIHLSTEEYEHLFDWKRVMAEVKVIHPLFYVCQANGSLKMQAVWAKSCRGAMVRFILENSISSPEELKAFSYEGFKYSPNHGEESYPHFIRHHI